MMRLIRQHLRESEQHRRRAREEAYLRLAEALAVIEQDEEGDDDGFDGWLAEQDRPKWRADA